VKPHLGLIAAQQIDHSKTLLHPPGLNTKRH
jgi:hypothetical protein